jgi:hypothetical protein
MKNLYYFFLLLVILSGCNSAEKKNHLKELGLKGKVKSIHEVRYNAVEKFGQIEKGDIVRGPGVEKMYIFNELGNKIEVIDYTSYRTPLLKWVYNYDDKNRLIEQDQISLWDSIYLSYKWKMIYDLNDKLSEINYFTPEGSLDGKRLYKYSNEGNKIEEQAYNKEGALEFCIFQKFDRLKNPIEEGYTEGLDTTKSTSKYLNGFPVEKVMLDSEGEASYYWKYKYDKNGNIIEERQHDKNGRMTTKTTYTYEYDNENNWTKQIIYVNGKSKIVISREIEYYKL